jgi:hypothetical protein
VKKCASCSKDLPDAALHCVFCGAKQAPAPAVQPGLAKTAFGYSANEVMQQLGNPPPAQAPRAHSPSQGASPSAKTVMVDASAFSPAQPVSQPPTQNPAFAATAFSGTPPATAPDAGFGQAPPGAGGGPSGYGGAPSDAPPSPGYGGPPAASPGYGRAPAASPGSGGAPSAGYGGPPPNVGYGGAPSAGYGGSPAPRYGGPPAPNVGYGGAPAGGGFGGAPGAGPAAPGNAGYGGAAGGLGAHGGGMGIHSPPQPTPSPLPVAQPPPYLASQTAARAGRPVEPWRDSLRFMMFVWGALALASFATPLSVDPLAFNWDAIIDGAGVAKLPPMLWAAVGLLSIAVAAIPMPTLPRGIIAAALGLAGSLVPAFLGGMPPWQALLPMIGLLTLIPGLLVRNEYTDSLLARVLVTIGVVATLAPLLIPSHGSIPLVGIFKGLIDAPGEAKVTYILQITMVVLVVMSLLVWMPGPASGGAKVFAWAIILFTVVEFFIALLVGGGIGDMISKAPGMLVVWAPLVTYIVLVGYGVATIIGKQLE